MNIVSGQMADRNCNVHEAVSRGKEVIQTFRNSWPSGFYQTISQSVVVMDASMRFIKIGEYRVYDQSFIFARISDLILSNKEMKMEDCLATKLVAYPPTYFDEEGKSRIGTKSTLISALAVNI